MEMIMVGRDLARFSARLHRNDSWEIRNALKADSAWVLGTFC